MLDQQIIFALDKVGILAFSFTGVAMGIEKKLDIFGLLVIGVASAIGGGIIRDLLLARMPFAISNSDYLLFSCAASVFAIVLFYLNLPVHTKILTLADTLGFSAFAVSGAVVSIDLNLGILHTVLFSVLTAVGGGLIRDIMLNKVPFVLRKETYATIAAIGGLMIHFLFLLGLNIADSVYLGLILIILLRLFSIRKGFHLPVIK